jgi:hypothetical protein
VRWSETTTTAMVTAIPTIEKNLIAEIVLKSN